MALTSSPRQLRFRLGRRSQWLSASAAFPLLFLFLSSFVPAFCCSIASTCAASCAITFRSLFSASSGLNSRFGFHVGLLATLMRDAESSQEETTQNSIDKTNRLPSQCRQHQSLIRRHTHQIPAPNHPLIVFDAGRAVSAVRRIMRPTSETPIRSKTMSTAAETRPHSVSSIPIRSATGSPSGSPSPSANGAMEIAVDVTMSTMHQRIGRKMAPTSAHFHQSVRPNPSGGSLRNRSRKKFARRVPTPRYRWELRAEKARRFRRPRRCAIPIPSR